jgi:signal transduction histidine kinase
MKTRSVHFRLTVWYAAVLAAALALFGVLIQVSLRQRLLSDLDQDVAASAARFEAYFRKEAAEESGRHLIGELDEFCQALPAANYLALRGSEGFVFRYPEHVVVKDNLRVARREFRIGAESYSLEAGASTRSLERTLQLLGLLLIGLVPAVIAVACLGGAWLSRRALSPVDEITLAARGIEIDNLSQRLPVPATSDELQRLTEVWNSMLARLEGAVRTLSQFAADASHELRTPLAVIRTAAEIALRRARSTESYRESLEEISVEAERMTQLVEDLLFLAHSGYRAASLKTESVELRSLLREVSAELHELAKLRNIEVRLRCPESEIAVPGTRPALRRLFLALMDNALKYSHPRGAVEVAVAAEASRVTVTFEDHGVGISEADLPHVFRRFYRADKARGNGDGYGLGLSIASTIAEEHGAQISVASVEGRGSVFSVQFREALKPLMLSSPAGTSANIGGL